MKKVAVFSLILIFSLGISACNKAIQNETSSVKNNVQENQIEYSLPINADEDISEMEAAQTSVNDVSFNFETKTVTLNSGYEMPIYGIGTYSLLNEECVNSVQAALENGVRLIDTAYMYHNDVICCEV